MDEVDAAVKATLDALVRVSDLLSQLADYLRGHAEVAHVTYGQRFEPRPSSGPEEGMGGACTWWVEVGLRSDSGLAWLLEGRWNGNAAVEASVTFRLYDIDETGPLRVFPTTPSSMAELILDLETAASALSGSRDLVDGAVPIAGEAELTEAIRDLAAGFEVAGLQDWAYELIRARDTPNRREAMEKVRLVADEAMTIGAGQEVGLAWPLARIRRFLRTAGIPAWGSLAADDDLPPALQSLATDLAAMGHGSLADRLMQASPGERPRTDVFPLLYQALGAARDARDGGDETTRHTAAQRLLTRRIDMLRAYVAAAPYRGQGRAVHPHPASVQPWTGDDISGRAQA